MCDRFSVVVAQFWHALSHEPKQPRQTLKQIAEAALVNKTGEEGFEPPTPWSVATCSSPLSYTPLQELNSNTVSDANIVIFHG